MEKVKENLLIKYGKGSLHEDAVARFFDENNQFARVNYPTKVALTSGQTYNMINNILETTGALAWRGGTLNIEIAGLYELTLNLWLAIPFAVKTGDRIDIFIRQGTKVIAQTVLFPPAGASHVCLTIPSTIANLQVGALSIFASLSGFTSSPIINGGVGNYDSFYTVRKIK